jgi:hypothetical protein
LSATTVIQDSTGLKTTPVDYSVEEVLVDGVLVVDRGQPRFDLAVLSAQKISLKLYPVHLRGHGALYGFPLPRGGDRGHALSHSARSQPLPLADATYHPATELEPIAGRSKSQTSDA